MVERLNCCADCGLPKPQTETNYTLISARHGWRVTRRRQPDGTQELAWHCPECWMRRRAEPSTGKASGER
jgi:hypothetical protein